MSLPRGGPHPNKCKSPECHRMMHKNLPLCWKCWVILPHKTSTRWWNSREDRRPGQIYNILIQLKKEQRRRAKEEEEWERNMELVDALKELAEKRLALLERQM